MGDLIEQKPIKLSPVLLLIAGLCIWELIQLLTLVFTELCL
jgi:hypothetical protein